MAEYPWIRATRLGLLCTLVFTLTVHWAFAADPVNEADQFAWDLFVELNQEVPNTNGKVVWETWALARMVFADPQNPPAWPQADPSPRSLDEAEPLLQRLIARGQRGVGTGPHPQFDPSRPSINETRMNREAFDFIATNDLYYVEGQEAAFAADERIDFPLAAKEIKARWEPIDADQADRYHTAQVTDPSTGATQLWGLKSLHITTKDLPNWFWATFEHTDNPKRESVIPSRDRAGRPAQFNGTKWENYILRGTQIDFVDSTGVPTLLSNSIIEDGFEATSSCITCHARATIGPPVSGEAANRLPVFEAFQPVITGSIGVPDPRLFWDLPNNRRRYLQLDFVWSMFRAQRRSPAPAPTAAVGLTETMAATAPVADVSPGIADLLVRTALDERRPLAGATEAVDPTPRKPMDVSWQIDAAALSTEQFHDLVESLDGAIVVDEAAQVVTVQSSDGTQLQRLAGVAGVKLFESSSPRPIRDSPTAENLDARDTHQVEEAAQKHGLSGAGILGAVWDGGRVRTTHREFRVTVGGAVQSRVEQADGAPQLDLHATHVTGTITAEGVAAQAQGMATAARLKTHDWFNDTSEMVQRAADGVVSSNHSYGYPLGWEWVSNQGWVWYGSPNATTDYRFGKFVAASRQFDIVAHNHPSLSIFVAAGNDRNNNPPPGVLHRVQQTGQFSTQVRQGDGQYAQGFDTLGALSSCKNTIVIGAINDIITDPPEPSMVVPTDFSSWGPTDDGRVKPDVVANGFQLFSTSSAGDDKYHNTSGTSMATPTATGISLLLAECFGKHGVAHPRSDQMKAVLIHTAMSPIAGPDYRIGWGSIRADRATDLIAGSTGRVLTSQVGDQDAVWTGTAAGDGDLRATLVWIDPPGASNTGGANDRTATLVRDLDLNLTGPDGATHFPWSLDPLNPTAPATRSSENRRDNVERVDVAEAAQGQWKVRVRWSAADGQTQPFALVLSGLGDIDEE